MIGAKRFEVRRIWGSLVVGLATFAVQAEVTVKDAWVRGTVPSQTVTGAFMTVTSSEEAKIVAANSPAAKMTHVHATMMMGSVAHMRSVDQVPLPAGKAVELKPGGYHVMLTDLVRPVKAGEVVPITLTIEGKDGKRSQVEVKATVRPVGSR